MDNPQALFLFKLRPAKEKVPMKSGGYLKAWTHTAKLSARLSEKLS